MIKVKAIKTSDGTIFESVEEAKLHELKALLTPPFEADKDTTHAIRLTNFSAWAIQHRDQIVNLLTMKASSHPAARKANGATPRKRGRKPAATDPQPTLPGAAV